MLSIVSSQPEARSLAPPRIRYYSRSNLHKLRHDLPEDQRFAIRVVSLVLPFKVNNHVLDNLIDWSRVPDDPIYRLTFPHKSMLAPEDFRALARLVEDAAPFEQVKQQVERIRARLNPHPAGEHNVPTLAGRRLPGLQHKYRETVLFFPAQGQTCHAYCTFCFRWPQFVGAEKLKFQSRQVDDLVAYLKQHPEVSDVLITGGDPMIMPARTLATYLDALLGPGLEHVQTIRIGTKSVSYWPHRYLTDSDADEILRLFEKVVQKGKHLALMWHNNHPREIESEATVRAVQRLRMTGAQLRCQSPLVRHVNDSPEVWARMWRAQVKLGCIPYYMFVERDTGPRHYFEVPLVRAWEIFQSAYRRQSGLARTVRGPSMSATPGKVGLDGIAELAGEKVFVLHFIQGRQPAWVHRPFVARFDSGATWFDQLRPAFGRPHFFFEPELQALLEEAPPVASQAS